MSTDSNRCLRSATPWLVVLWGLLSLPAPATAADDEAGFRNLFDGRSLEGWRPPDASYWSVEDGAITGTITEQHPCTVNQYLVWQGGELADFELKLKSRILSPHDINGGFQFRSRALPNADVAGYQVDNQSQSDWLVRLYDEHGRHTLAWRGQRAVFDEAGRVTHAKIPEAEGPAPFRIDEWHEYHLVCRGPQLTLRVNGRLMAEVIDYDAKQQDLAGILALQLHSAPPCKVQFKDIRLRVLGPASRPATVSSRWPIVDKTLVAWVRVANLTQRGGSVLTLDNQDGSFDGIVFGELSPGKWMAGSNFFRRTQQEQGQYPPETAGAEDWVQMAAVYRGNEIALYRNGVLYARHTVGQPQVFGPDAVAVLGLRHLEAGDRACFVGEIDDARVYDGALDAAAIAAMKPNQPLGVKPLAWWTFENNKAEDLAGTFATSRLVGNARVTDGRLVLGGGPGYLVAGGDPPRDRASEDWPTYHVSALPEEGACMPYDANGCIFWKGKYHLMYIYQDLLRPHGGHCWGHASSSDLVNWTYHPPALVPEPGDADVGIFSGNAFVNKDGVPMLCWFGINAGVCVATAMDADLIRWKKHPKNPIIPIPKAGEPGHGVYTVWDPYLWLEDDTYYCLLGGNQLPGGKDTLYAMKSSDLVRWTPVGPFYEHPDPNWTESGEDCSCPDFFKLGDRRVLMCISHKIGARCYVGRFENERFKPERHVRMNWPGGMFFAPESLEDARGRRVFWAWVTDPRLGPTQRDTGSGAQSLPRILSLAEDGSLRIAPAPELETLRRTHRRMENVSVPADGEVRLEGFRGDCLELRLRIETGKARRVGLKVRCSPDGREETGIWYDAAGSKLIIDASRSTLRKDVTYASPPFAAFGFRRASDNQHPRAVVEAPLQLREGEPLELRVFMDKPLLEVFANERQCITQQVYPESRTALDIRLCAEGGAARAALLEAWDMAPAQFINQKTALAGKTP